MAELHYPPNRDDLHYGAEAQTRHTDAARLSKTDSPLLTILALPFMLSVRGLAFMWKRVRPGRGGR